MQVAAVDHLIIEHRCVFRALAEQVVVEQVAQ
jgi:hypothetical protein